MNDPWTTRFAGLRREVAVGILVFTAATILCCLAVSLTAVPAPGISVKGGGSDWDFYQGVTDRVRAGQSYYEALPAMFREYDYTPSSLFNYRTPIYAWVIGGLPNPEWAQLVLAGLALLTVGLAYQALRREAVSPVAGAGALLVFGGLGWCFLSRSMYAQEVWASTLVTMSVCLYVLGRWPWAVLAGLAALFFRELTLPYCMVALGFAAWQRRPKEVMAWAGGLALYGAFMTWHLMRVTALLPPGSGGGALSWVTFGGLRFLLETCQMHLVLLAFLPAWATAVYLPLTVLGLVGWRGEMGARVWLTVAAYLAAFCVVGQSFNKYWGLMYTPLLSLGLLWAPLALRDLWRAGQGKPKSLVAHASNDTAKECADNKSSNDSGTKSH